MTTHYQALAAGMLLAALAPLATAQNAGVDWSLHLGGSGDEAFGWHNGICALDNGETFVVGSTKTPPTQGGHDVLAARISPTGAVLWSVTFGGSRDERAGAVTYSPATDQLYVAGWTESADFPVTPTKAMQSAIGGGSDVFVAVLDPANGAIRYATFLGGSVDEGNTDLHVDGAGTAWVYGWTDSPNFPTTPDAWSQNPLGGYDLFIARFDPSIPGPSALLYSTYFGSPGTEPKASHSDMHVDPNGVVTVFSDTDSNRFPTTPNAWSRVYGGGSSDAVVCRLDPSLPPASQLVWSTYFGGSGLDSNNGMAIHDGIVWITGHTQSTNLPTTPNAPQPGISGPHDAYLFALDPSQPGPAQAVWGSYYGGPRTDGANGIAVDASGLVTITGTTSSPTLPGTTPGSFQQTQPATTFPSSFVARFDPARNRIEYASFFGTPGAFETDLGPAVPDPLGGVYFLGWCDGTLPGSINPHAGLGDIAVVRFNMLPRGAERCATDSPTCGERLFVGVNGWPKTNDPGFALRCSGMPGGSRSPIAGVLLVDVAASCGPLQPLLGADILIPFGIAVTLPAASGTTTVPLPLVGVPAGASASFQFVWVNPSACGPAFLSASNVLKLVVQC